MSPQPWWVPYHLLAVAVAGAVVIAIVFVPASVEQWWVGRRRG